MLNTCRKLYTNFEKKSKVFPLYSYETLKTAEVIGNEYLPDLAKISLLKEVDVEKLKEALNKAHDKTPAETARIINETLGQNTCVSIEAIKLVELHENKRGGHEYALINGKGEDADKKSAIRRYFKKKMLEFMETGVFCGVEVGAVAATTGAEYCYITQEMKEGIAKQAYYRTKKLELADRAVAAVKEALDLSDADAYDAMEIFMKEYAGALQNAAKTRKLYTLNYVPTDLNRYTERGEFNIFTPSKSMVKHAGAQEKYTAQEAAEALKEKAPATYTLLRNLFTDKHIPYILNRIAFIAKKRDKTGVALVIFGAQGAGKNLYAEHIMRRIVGNTNATEIGSRQLTNNFNAIFSAKLYVVGNEVIINAYEDKRHKGSIQEIKRLITDKNTILNDKNVSEIEIDNFVNLDIFSNSHKSITIDPDDRRFAVFNADTALTEIVGDTGKFVERLKEEYDAVDEIVFSIKVDESAAKKPIWTKDKAELIRNTNTTGEVFKKFTYYGLRNGEEEAIDEIETITGNEDEAQRFRDNAEAGVFTIADAELLHKRISKRDEELTPRERRRVYDDMRPFKLKETLRVTAIMPNGSKIDKKGIYCINKAEAEHRGFWLDIDDRIFTVKLYGKWIAFTTDKAPQNADEAISIFVRALKRIEEIKGGAASDEAKRTIIAIQNARNEAIEEIGTKAVAMAKKLKQKAESFKAGNVNEMDSETVETNEENATIDENDAKEVKEDERENDAKVSIAANTKQQRTDAETDDTIPF